MTDILRNALGMEGLLAVFKGKSKESSSKEKYEALQIDEKNPPSIHVTWTRMISTLKKLVWTHSI